MDSASLFTKLRGKRVVVMGLGLHGGGVATTNWLTRRGALVTVTDLRPARILRASLRNLRRRNHVDLVLGRHRAKDFSGADMVVQNPAVPNTSPFLGVAKKARIPIVNEATIFFALSPSRTIGITGTKGKSTVSALTAHLLKQKFGARVVLAGNIRETAMLDALDRLTPKSIAVLELSSWQLEGLPTMRRSPHIAVVTNILDDHLNRYPSRAAYADAKANIFRWQRPGDLTILNRDNPVTRSWGKNVPGRVLWYSAYPLSKGSGAFIDGATMFLQSGTRRTRIAATHSVPLLGSHMVQNALPAILVARTLGVSVRKIAEGLRTFHGLPGRLQVVRRVHGVTYVNDTTATAPVGTVASLGAFPAKVVLIAGGVDKNLSYNELAVAIKNDVRGLILLPGTATDKLLPLLKNFHGVIRRVATMREAVRTARRMARVGETVLLSPAAASFNLFLHEFDRGEQFNRAVRAIR